MIGLGTIINTGAIIVGGLIGVVFKKKLSERIQDTLVLAGAVSTMFIAIAGAMEGLLGIEGNLLSSRNGFFLVVCLSAGGLIGELLNLEGLMQRFGAYLQEKTKSTEDNGFISAFILASCTVSVGAMAVMGSIEDGINGDISILCTKAILDAVFIMMLSAKFGKGCVFSAIPVFVFQGLMTLLAKAIAPVLTETAVFNLSFVGNVIIFCISINLIWDKKIRVLNFIPAMILAAIAAYLPF